MALRVYSTLTREKLDFEKVTGKKPHSNDPADMVTMYVCGPTVYKPSHIGHMVGPVIFDTVKRYLTYLGYKVKWVVNITDVDDKLINRAKELNTTVPALAEQMTQDYFKCLDALNVKGIDAFPRATQHIGGMIDVINALIKKDYAYEVDDGVYFDVSKDEDYGKLSNRDPEQMEAGTRMEPNAKKRNPGDFALWKSKPGEPEEVQFASPFKCGRGRPGWHIECTCMAFAELGETLDIHGGGLDLQFPHHENELAQTESWTGKPFARFWMHNGLLKMGSAKMAGSVGNVVNIADLLKRHSAETVRFLLLSTHYRSPIEYSEERLDEVKRSVEGFYLFFEEYEAELGESFYSLPTLSVQEMSVETEFLEGTTGESRTPFSPMSSGLAFLSSMENDFNTGEAIGVLFKALNKLNFLLNIYKKTKSKEHVEEATGNILRRLIRELRTMANILGLFWVPPAKKSLGEVASGSGVGAGGDDVRISTENLERLQRVQDTIEGLMQLLLDLRNNLRTIAKDGAKDNPLKKPLFDQTDLIRKRLGELGVTLEDRPGGTTWRVG